MIVHHRNNVFENIQVFLESNLGHLDAQVLVGSMCYTASEIRQLKTKGKLILFNIEQIDPAFKFPGVHRPPGFLENFKLFDEVWDYDPINIKRLSSIGIEAKYLPFVYTEELNRYTPNEVEDIDVLFYGSMSPKRTTLIENIKKANPGKNIVVTTGLFADTLDDMLKRAKIVLNCHYIDWADIQEQTRIFYPLINGTTVVSESNPFNHYGDLIYNTPREDIPQVIKQILDSDDERKTRAFEASVSFKKMSETFDWSLFE